MCERLGYETVDAGNGADAWEKCQQDPIPIIISDLVMPKMDGISFCKQIRTNNKDYDPFFFLITGKMTSRANYAEALEAGVDDFLYKPASLPLFRESLSKAERAMASKGTELAK